MISNTYEAACARLKKKVDGLFHENLDALIVTSKKGDSLEEGYRLTFSKTHVRIERREQMKKTVWHCEFASGDFSLNGNRSDYKLITKIEAELEAIINDLDKKEANVEFKLKQGVI
jgi:hypothetical protein